MKKKLLTAAVAAAALSASTVFAGGHDEMEKCKVLDNNNQGLIKEGKADCAGKNHSCSGHNKAGDADSWILVPKGHCDVINKYINEVPQDVKDKIEGA